MTRVLLAEDDTDLRELVRAKLRQAGFEVDAVADGQSALDRARAQVPDLVVLDLMMPRLSGLDVCRVLRAVEVTAHIPVIMLTARSQEADVARGFAVGADDYVIKPFSPRELLSRVQAVLSRARR